MRLWICYMQVMSMPDNMDLAGKSMTISMPIATGHEQKVSSDEMGQHFFDHSHEEKAITTDDESDSESTSSDEMSSDHDNSYGVKDLTPQNSVAPDPKKRVRRQTTMEFKENLGHHIFDTNALMEDVVNQMADEDEEEADEEEEVDEDF